MENILNAFTTLTAMVTGIIFVAEIIDRLWNLDGTASSIRQVVIGILFGVAGAGLKLGMFADPYIFTSMAWYMGGAIIGLAAGAMAAWSFVSMPIVKFILELLKIRVPTSG